MTVIPWASKILSKSYTVSEINVLLRFTQKFKMAAKIAGKQFWQKLADDCVYLGGHRNHSIWPCFREKCTFVLYTEIQNGHQNGGKTSFGQNCQMTVDTLGLSNFVEIALSRTVYEILKILLLLRKNVAFS